MSTLALPGIYTSIDTGALVEAELAAARRPLLRFQRDQTAWQQKVSSLQQIRTALAQLQDLVSSMRGRDSIRAARASSADANIVSVSASAGASPGSHEVTVNQLAAAEAEVHEGLTPTETWTHIRAVATADSEYLSAQQISDAGGDDYRLVFQFGDEPQVTVDLSAYDETGLTLNELVAEINAAAGYTAASTVESDTGFQLRLQAQLAGDDADFVVTDNASIGAMDDTDDFTRTVAGDDGGSAVVGAGTFVYTYNGITRTVTTSATTTLGALRNLINNDTQNPGVQASILDYEADADHRYHLVLRGQDTGADYAITIEASTTLAGFAPGDAWTETSTARDTQFRVDGYPASGWISRGSNTVTDVVPGATLDLKAVGTTTVSLTRSTEQLQQDLSNLATIYNRAKTLLADSTGYDAESGVGGIFQGDYTVNTLLNGIRRALTMSADGFSRASDTFSLATDAGLKIDRDGMISFDASVFNVAIGSNYVALLDLIAARGSGATDSDFVQFNSAAEGTTAGAYEMKVDFDAAGAITGAWFRTLGEGEDDWREAAVDGYTIRGATDNPEQYLSVTVTEDPAQAGGAHTQEAQIRVKHGLAVRIYNELETMLDSYDGTIQLKLDQYNDRLTELDRRIEQQEARIELQAERLRERYARLEEFLAAYDSQRASVTAMVEAFSVRRNQNTR